MGLQVELPMQELSQTRITANNFSQIAETEGEKEKERRRVSEREVKVRKRERKEQTQGA